MQKLSKRKCIRGVLHAIFATLKNNKITSNNSKNEIKKSCNNQE